MRLLGESYIAFRAEDGRVGFLDELCPHRRASLALGRMRGKRRPLHLPRLEDRRIRLRGGGPHPGRPARGSSPPTCHVAHFPRPRGGRVGLGVAGRRRRRPLPRPPVHRRTTAAPLVDDRHRGFPATGCKESRARSTRPTSDSPPDVDREAAKMRRTRQPEPSPSTAPELRDRDHGLRHAGGRTAAVQRRPHLRAHHRAPDAARDGGADRPGSSSRRRRVRRLTRRRHPPPRLLRHLRRLPADAARRDWSASSHLVTRRTPTTSPGCGATARTGGARTASSMKSGHFTGFGSTCWKRTPRSRPAWVPSSTAPRRTFPRAMSPWPTPAACFSKRWVPPKQASSRPAAP